MNFLGVEATELDVGLSLPLQRRAQRYETETEQIAFLARDDVQEMLVTFLVGVAASTLEVERRHAQAKRWEARRLSHVATASRDCILRRYRAERAASEAQDAALRADRAKAQKMNKWSAAWQRCLGLRPEGQRFCREWSAQPQAPPQPQARARGGGARADQGRHGGGSNKRQRLSQGPSADADEMRTYVAEHETDPQEEVAQFREAVARRWAAHQAQRRLHVVPSGLGEWVKHLQAHESEFRNCVRTATTERREKSRRLRAASDIPEGVPRLQPQAPRWRPLARGWARTAWGRSGWYVIGIKGDAKIFFLYSYSGRTHFMDMTLCRTVEGIIVLDHKFSLPEMLHHLSCVEEPSASADLPVHELTMTATATEEGVCLRPAMARLIDASAPRPKQPKEPADEDESDDSLDGWMPPDSIPSSNGSVDTDVEDDDCVEDDEVAEEAREGEELAAAGAEAVGAATGAEAHLGADLGGGVELSSGDEQPPSARHAAGTYVVWTNGYFFLSDHPDQKFLRIQMYRHWCSDEQMGNHQMSKQLSPSQFGEERADPRITKALLRAWAMWRMRLSPEWLAAHDRRNRQLARDEAELERDVRALPGRITGEPRADDMLKNWAPEVADRL